MKVEKIDYKIGCDMPGCSCLSSYSLVLSENGPKIHLCENCIKKLKNTLKGV